MKGTWVGALAFLVAAVLLAGCGGSSGRHPLGVSAVGSSTAAAVTTGALPPPPAPALDAVPVIFVHGINGHCQEYEHLLDRVGEGRTVVREMYVDEADALAKDSYPKDSVFAFGYYKSNVGGPDYDVHGSIGGCPVPRNDGLDASYYTTSYAERLRRGVEGVKRATGSKKVDLVLHSMGGIVGRAYTKWLSLDPSGESSVRRILLLASPSRGINALECVGLAVAHSGNVEFMRQGECLELCHESTMWSGKSYMELLNDDWDGFCSRKGILYAGISATGPRGVAGGSSGSVIPASGIPLGPIQQFLTGLSQTSSLTAVWPLVGEALAHLPSEALEALGPSDGTVRLESSRLDKPPFLGAAFWATFEGSHSDSINPEQTGHGATFAAECVRAFLFEGRTPGVAKCDRIDLTPVDAPGRTTWIQVDVKTSGATPERSPLALQLVESVLDAKGDVVSSMGYGAALTKGEHRLAFAVPAGGGTRRYRAVVYGEHGPIGLHEADFTLTDGALDDAPQAKLSASAKGDSVHLDLASNAAGATFSVRFDDGPWLDWTARTAFDSPPLLPGSHRIEVRAKHAGNGAGVACESALPASVGVAVSATGAVRIIP